MRQDTDRQNPGGDTRGGKTRVAGFPDPVSSFTHHSVLLPTTIGHRRTP